MREIRRDLGGARRAVAAPMKPPRRNQKRMSSPAAVTTWHGVSGVRAAGFTVTPKTPSASTVRGSVEGAIAP